ncbi:MAG: Imidazolonepropionase [Haliscomenobacter sp.]|jgi:imidazolonepropionase|nr:Imidazolonepropionase [Haliscomenobacter sp.]
MSHILIQHIRLLAGVDSSGCMPMAKGEAMRQLPIIENAFVWVEGAVVKAFGPQSECPDIPDARKVDAAGRLVLPAWCDSHTHLVFATTRESEFVDRIQGLSYEAIAQKGGGILNSARRLNEMPEDALFEASWERLQEVQRKGTGAIEIKSGYGLTLEAELKMLRVIRRLKEKSGMTIKSTFLGAHALPLEYRSRREDYIRQLIEVWIPAVAHEQLADYLDVFCEKNFFTPEETSRILEAGVRWGLKGKIHVNQFHSLGGIQTAIRHGALSVDHLEVMTEEDIADLASSAVIPTLLPSAPFFLNDSYPPARRLIDAGMGVALATDFNPGSSPSGSMPLVLTLACTQMGMTPEEAIHGATLNGAYAMEIQDLTGSIAPGKLANLIITKPAPSLAYLPYAFGTDWIDTVLINGAPVASGPAPLFN